MLRLLTRSGFIALALVAFVPPAMLVAQNAPERRAPYSARAGKEVIDSMAAILRARYADADTGAMIAAHIQRRLAEGAYARVTDWGKFVSLATQDLQSVNEDTHLVLQMGGMGGQGEPHSHGVEAVERLEGNVGYIRMINFSLARRRPGRSKGRSGC